MHVQSGYPTYGQGHKKWTEMSAKQMPAMFAPQEPKQPTDDATGDETFISFYGTPSKQANAVGVNEARNRPVVFRPGFQSKKQLFTLVFNQAGPPRWSILCQRRHQWATTTTQEQYCQKLLRLSRRSDQTRGPQEIVTPWQYCSPTKQGPQFQHLEGRNVSPAPSIQQPWHRTKWL